MVSMGFEFVADRPVLDFVPTVAKRGTTDEEKLRTPEDLALWAQQSGIVEYVGAVSDDDVRHARAVREAIFRLLAALIDQQPPSASARAVVNRAAAQPGPQLRLDEAGRLHRTGGVDALLAALASDCLDLFASPDRSALHWCADERCTRPFLDRSRGQRRRWCGMKGCGDRAKAAAYRERQRQAARW